MLDDIIIDKKQFTEAEKKMFDKGYISMNYILNAQYENEYKYIRFYEKEVHESQITFNMKSLNSLRTIIFNNTTQTVRFGRSEVDIGLLNAIIERCKELGWDKK